MRAAVMAMALSGCAATGAPPVEQAAMCDAAKVQQLVGQPADGATAEAQRLSGARTVRRYGPGAALTMDYRADRLNVETDAAGVIVKLSCG